nr:hypothetical protein [uncultured Methanoregula sp.]
MKAAIRLQDPFIDGDRKIYPVVTETGVTMGLGMTATVTPVALIIEEGGDFTGATLEETSLEDILRRLIAGEQEG